MKSYIISYDLNKPGQDYNSLYEAIKTYSNWCHPHKSIWIIKSDDTASAIHKNLMKYIDINDTILVVNLSREAAWNNLSQKNSDWLKSEL